uniref:Uncharacterized protein n=1 Tax=Oryza meridionalis TaxID=40149 RepID=A0A0E0DD64_9ORYZ
MEAAVGGETGRRREGDGFDSGEKGEVRQKRIARMRLRQREGGAGGRGVDAVRCKSSDGFQPGNAQ